LLTHDDIARLADLPAVIRVVRGAFLAMARGDAFMPPKVYLPLPGGGDFRAMPAYVPRPPAAGVKWVNVHPRNPSRGLPAIMAVIVINDPATGVPLAVMDGRLITKLRTAASAAVAARALARHDSRAVGLIGCGAQADAQLEALAQVLPIERAHVWGHAPGEAERFCRRMRRELPRLACVPCAALRQAVEGMDVVVTLTPSRRPLVQRAWVSAGTHINAIGADAPGKQEVDPRILRDAVVVVDHREQAIHAGELNVPIRRRQYAPSRIHAELGDVLAGRAAGRRSAREITLFDSTGLAVHDVAVGAWVLRRAQRRGVGHLMELVGSTALRDA
jgi:alanine dehydrogenase